MKNKSKIAKKIKTVMIAKDLTIADVSKATGVKITDISKMRNGRKADEKMVQRVLDYLGIDEQSSSVNENDSDPIDDLFKFMQAIPKDKERGEFTCPLCGGKARFYHTPLNGHLHAMCNDCMKRVLQ